MPNYLFFDFETSQGMSKKIFWGEITQAAFVLTNDDFEVLDSWEGSCRLSNGVIPESMAILIQKVTMKELEQRNLSNYLLVRQMVEKISSWKNSIFFGYNSALFDEHVLRNTLFQNLEYPYVTVSNGNERGDILNLARCCELYYPGSIKTEINKKTNNPIFKLQSLAPTNGITKFKFHNAMDDVLATIEISKLIKKKAPNVWKAGLMTTNKDKCLRIIKEDLLFCTSFFYGRARPSVLTYVCEHPWGNPCTFDLKEDPNYYFNLSMQDLKKEIFFGKPKVFKMIKHKDHPIIMNPKYGTNFDSYKQLGLEKLRLRAKQIRDNKNFREKVSAILNDDIREKEETDSQLDVYAEESIYKGKFASKEDNAVMSEFHKAEWKDKFSILQKFQDERYKYFAKKILYKENPDSLPKEEYASISKEIARRVLSINDEPFNTIPRTFSEIDTLRNKFKDDEEKLKALEEIDSYIQKLEKNYQKAS